MKPRSSANAKTRYFRKDYAPARLAKTQKKLGRKVSRTSAQISHEVNQNLKKTEKVTTKVGKNLKRAATKTSQAVKKTASTVKRSISKSSRSSHTGVNLSSPSVNSRSATASSRANPHSSSNHTRRATPKHQRTPLTWREITLISQISVSAAIIAFAFAFCAINDPVRRSEQELAKLADAYYIEYLYPSSLGDKLYQPETVLADYVKSGLPSVKLRQLLLYNNGQHASSIEAFSNPYYKCDTNQSYVRYYPVEPYGPRDYVVTYNPACEKVSND